MGKLVHPSIITRSKIFELFRFIVSLYTKFDFRVSINSLLNLFLDHVCRFYDSLQIFIQTGAPDPPARLPTITQIYDIMLELSCTGTWQKSSNLLNQESEHGRTGSTAKSNHCLDITKKQNTVGKALKEVNKAFEEEPLKEIGPSRPCKLRAGSNILR